MESNLRSNSIIVVAVVVITTVVSVTVSKIHRKFQQKRAESERIRRHHGTIRVDDKDKIYVYSFFSNDDYGRALPDGVDPDQCVRVRLPDGAAYSLHLADAVQTDNRIPWMGDLTPTRTVLLDPGPSETVISRAVLRQGNVPRVLVCDETRLLLDYAPKDWPAGISSTHDAQFLPMKQTAFEPHEMIRIFWWTSGEETRGITLWLEPQGRQAQPGAEEITTEQKNAPVRGDDAPDIDHSEAAEKKLWAKSILNQKAPELTVEKWLSEKPSTEGKFVLIDFWATWCGPCIKAIPELNEFQKKYEDNLVVIGISDESPDTVAKFSSPKIEYFSAIDTKATTKKILGVSGIPHVIILDPEGIVRWEGFPFLDGHELSSAVLDELFTKYGETLTERAIRSVDPLR